MPKAASVHKSRVSKKILASFIVNANASFLVEVNVKAFSALKAKSVQNYWVIFKRASFGNFLNAT